MSSLVSPSSVAQPSESKEDCSSGLVDHTVGLVENMEAQFSNPEFWDVTFVVDGERFHAHKFILATRSEYFRAMLYGGLRESAEAEIELNETKPLDFRTLLRYIYTAKVDLSEFNVEELLSTLQLAHQYGLLGIQHAVAAYLKTKLDVSNVFTVSETSTLLSLNALSEGCRQFCDQHAPKILAAQEFLTLPMRKVAEMLVRNSFCAAEIDVFHGLTKWIHAQHFTEPGDVATLIGRLITKNCLRLHLMSQKELLTTVGGSKIFATNSGVLDKHILAAIRQRDSNAFGLRFRGSLLYHQNVATNELGAVFLVGGDPNMLLSGGGKMSSCRSSPQQGHRSGIAENNDEIVLQLGRPYTINTVVLKHQDWQTGRAYSYRVDVSLDRHDWARVNSHRCQTKSSQTLLFDARLVRKRQHSLKLPAIMSYNSISAAVVDLLIPELLW